MDIITLIMDPRFSIVLAPIVIAVYGSLIALEMLDHYTNS